MILTGLLTAGVSFGVYLFALRTETPEVARTHAFAALVFAELLRAFGARSETRPIWRMNLFANRPLLAVVVVSIGLQIWSQHNAILGTFLRSSPVSFADLAGIFAVSAIPLLTLEARKVFSRQRDSSAAQ